MKNLAGALLYVSACLLSAEEKTPMPEAVDLSPFWASTTMTDEGLFFVKEKDGEPPRARLLFTPIEIKRLRSASHEITYEEGKDYTVDKAAKTISLTGGSRIPFRTRAELYPPKGSKNAIQHKKGDPNTYLYFSEGHFYHDIQSDVTYTHSGKEWKGYVPVFAGEKLSNVMKKLAAKEPLKLCISGDSISAGANASKATKAPPFLPMYGELVAAELEKKYGSVVTLKNFAVGGWKSSQGKTDAARVVAEKPDLVIIAYGMNDVGNRSPKPYQENVKAIMDAVKADNPKAEFILVASMLGNAEWAHTPNEQFPLYRDALTQLCGDGVILADMTALWTDLLKEKKFHDLTGNGVNHPNDFGHRLYAQVILSLLTTDERR